MNRAQYDNYNDENRAKSFGNSNLDTQNMQSLFVTIYMHNDQKLTNKQNRIQTNTQIFAQQYELMQQQYQFDRFFYCDSMFYGIRLSFTLYGAAMNGTSRTIETELNRVEFGGHTIRTSSVLSSLSSSEDSVLDCYLGYCDDFLRWAATSVALGTPKKSWTTVPRMFASRNYRVLGSERYFRTRFIVQYSRAV